MNYRFKLISGVGCCVLGAPLAHAQLWDTGTWDQIDGRASDRSTPSVRPETRAADDFVLPDGNGLAYAITGISGRILALHYTGFFAEVFADDNGVPAAAPSYTLQPSGTQVLQSGVFGVYDLVNVAIDTTGLTLTPGRWWVSIVGNVSGEAPPADGYGFFATGGNMVVQGNQGYYRVASGPWTASQVAFGFPTDFSFTVLGAQLPPPPPACYANCDQSTTPPILNVNDFLCFLNKFASSDSYANCDQSTTPPVLNVNDFLCFLNKFASGCS